MTSAVSRLLSLAVVASLFLGGLLSPPAAQASTIDTAAKQAVLDAYRNVWAPAHAVPITWTGSVDTCTPGSVSAAAHQATLDTVNFYRSMAGLNPVSFNPTLSARNQADALLIAANLALSHTPPTSSKCYTPDAALAASHSNIAGSPPGSTIAAGAHAIDLYMIDPTVVTVGHRRWLLYPPTRTMGSGSTDHSNSLYVSGDTAVAAPGTFSNPAWVTWPTAGYFPRQMEPQGLWSITGNAARAWDFRDATVSVQGPSGAVPVTKQVLAPGYGNDTLVWKLGSAVPAVSGSAELVYDVTVSGIRTGSGAVVNHSYRVIMFNPESYVTTATPTKVDECGSASDAYTLPAVTGVMYRVNGVTKVAGTYPTGGASSVAITAASSGGYVLSGTTSWTLIFGTAQCTLTPSGPPSIVGATVVGSTMAVDDVTWNQVPSSLTYQWNRVTAAGSTPIAAAVDDEYVLTGEDLGAKLAVTTTAGRAGYGTVVATSEATETVTSAPTGTAGTVRSLSPRRLMDTRETGAVAPGGTITLKVAGLGGVPANGVGAAILNVTVTDTSAAGFITVYPSGTAKPMASNLNFVAGQTVANLVAVKLGGDGSVQLTNTSIRSVQLVADVAAYFLAGAAPDGGAFTPLPPSRLLDTREGNGAQGPVAGDATVALQVTGRGGVPATGVAAIVLNVTVTNTGAAGFITAYPSGSPLPLASNLNFVAGQVVPNLAIIKVGPDGKVLLTNTSVRSVDLVADVAGYFAGGTPSARGAYVALEPRRVLDSRVGQGFSGPVGAGSAVPLTLAGQAGIPASGVGAVVMNATVTAPQAPGFITVYPAGSPRPNASNLNFTASQTVPNLVVAKPSPDGRVSLANASPGTSHLVADVTGYFIG